MYGHKKILSSCSGSDWPILLMYMHEIMHTDIMFKALRPVFSDKVVLLCWVTEHSNFEIAVIGNHNCNTNKKTIALDTTDNLKRIRYDYLFL